jgi:hypothetical protein
MLGSGTAASVWLSRATRKSHLVARETRATSGRSGLGPERKTEPAAWRFPKLAKSAPDRYDGWTSYGWTWDELWSFRLQGKNFGNVTNARRVVQELMADRGIGQKDSYRLAVRVTASPEWKAERFFHREHYRRGDWTHSFPGPPSVDSDDPEEWWRQLPDGWDRTSRERVERQRVAENALLFGAPPDLQWAFFTTYERHAP